MLNKSFIVQVVSTKQNPISKNAIFFTNLKNLDGSYVICLSIHIQQIIHTFGWN